MRKWLKIAFVLKFVYFQISTPDGSTHLRKQKNAISIKTKNWRGVNSTNGIKFHPRSVDPHAFGVGDGVRPFLQLFWMRHCLYRLILTGILLELPSLWLETCQTLERCCFLLGLQCPASSVHHHNIHWCTGWHNNFNELYFWLFMSWERLEQLTWFLLSKSKQNWPHFFTSVNYID